MTEKEFSRILGDRVFGGPLAPEWTKAFREELISKALAVANEAGAPFEPEPRTLPELYSKGGPVIGRSIVAQSAACGEGWRYLTVEEADEVLRRCKAIKEAVGEICDHDWAVDPFLCRLRSILEGTK